MSRKRRAFVEAYLCCWCAAEAARRAGYSERTADRQGSRLLKNVEIQGLIEARLAEMAMSADEVLMRLADQARADIGEMMLPDGTISLSRAKQLGITHLINVSTIPRRASGWNSDAQPRSTAVLACRRPGLGLSIQQATRCDRANATHL